MHDKSDGSRAQMQRGGGHRDAACKLKRARVSEKRTLALLSFRTCIRLKLGHRQLTCTSTGGMG